MSDATAGGFGKFVPGFDFLQNLASQAAGGVAQGLGNSLPQMPNLSHWVAPTFNVEELDKRIEELKAVHFWLDQNTKALSATIQALEVQKMTLATLQTMNFSLGDVANALKIKAADTMSGLTGKTAFAGLEIPPRTYGTPAADAVGAPDEVDEDQLTQSAASAHEPAPEPSGPQRQARSSRTAKDTPAAPSGGVVDPVQWWGALSQQFQTIAANAMKDVARQTALDTTRQAATNLTEQAVRTATGMAGKAADTVARTVAASALGKAARKQAASAAPMTAPVHSARPANPAAATKAATKKAPPKMAAVEKTSTKKVAARKPATTAGTAPAQPLLPGDWTLPAAFFPGFQAPTGSAPAAKKPRAAAPARSTSRRR